MNPIIAANNRTDPNVKQTFRTMKCSARLEVSYTYWHNRRVIDQWAPSILGHRLGLLRARQKLCALGEIFYDTGSKLHEWFGESSIARTINNRIFYRSYTKVSWCRAHKSQSIWTTRGEYRLGERVDEESIKSSHAWLSNCLIKALILVQQTLLVVSCWLYHWCWWDWGVGGCNKLDFCLCRFVCCIFIFKSMYRTHQSLSWGLYLLLNLPLHYCSTEIFLPPTSKR